MKLAFVSTMGDAPWGGSEVLWTKTAAQALAEEHEVLFSSYDWKEQTPAPLLALEQQGARRYRRPRYEADLPARVRARLRRLAHGSSPEAAAIRRFRPDLVVVSQGGSHDVIYRDDLRMLLLEGKFPYAIICHSYRDPAQLDEATRQVIAAVLSQACRVFTISANQTGVLRRQLAHSLPNCEVVQNPVNLPATVPVPYPPQHVPAQLAAVGGLYVGSKGQDVLLDALGGPKWQSRDWQLNFYGTGPDQTYLERLAAFYGLTERVRFHGHVADSGAIWAANHVLVVPSRIESGPMVVAEAMRSGRTVVATPVGLVEEWVEPGVTGFVAAAALPRALEAALETCWSRRADWPALGQAAAAAAHSRLLPDPTGEFLRRLVEIAAVAGR